MPTRTNGTLSNSDRVGFQQRTWSIPGVTARLDKDGNRPIIIHALRGAASGVRTTRGFRLSMIGNGISSYATLISNKQPAASTSETAGHVPAVTVFTGVTDTRVANPSGSFTMRYEAFLSGAESSGATNNLLESGTTGTTDDLRVGNIGVSTSYWGGYDYYQVPTAPTIGSSSFSGSTATVTWSAPSDNGETAVTGYTVEYTTFPNFDAGQVFTTTTTNTSINIGVGAFATWYFRVYATNAVGDSQRSAVTSATASSPPTWSTTSFVDTAYVGDTYTRQLSASGTGTVTYALASGSLPSNVTLSSSGLLNGPISAGTSTDFTFRVNATASGQTTLSSIFTIARRQALPSWIDNTLSSDLRVGTPYSDSVDAANATSYSVSGLPSGGLVHNSGTVSGTPTSTSTIFFTITALNSDGASIFRNFSLTPKPRLPEWTDQTLSTTTIRVSQSYSDGVVASNATVYAVHSGSLPPGITLNTTTGALSGSPTTVGTYNFVLRAANAIDERIFTSTLTITVQPGGSGKVWNGTTWALAPFRVWNGSSWVESPAKVWNGSSWADPTV